MSNTFKFIKSLSKIENKLWDLVTTNEFDLTTIEILDGEKFTKLAESKGLKITKKENIFILANMEKKRTDRRTIN